MTHHYANGYGVTLAPTDECDSTAIIVLVKQQDRWQPVETIIVPDDDLAAALTAIPQRPPAGD